MHGHLNVIHAQFRVHLAVFGKCQIKLQAGRQLLTFFILQFLQ